MTSYLLIALAGFLASMVDGALGMGFGPTSATILLSAGVSPAATSATVNLAKVATGLAAGVSHWRFGNIDRVLVLQLAVPGAGGALIGTTILANVDGERLRPVLAVLLVLVGLRILVRFSRALPTSSRGASSNAAPPISPTRGTLAVGATGGVTNGLVGAWGPVVTPYLLQRGLPARYAIGSVNTAEVAVAVVSAGSLLGTLGGKGIELAVVASMLVGGVLAAPLAAYVVRFLPARALGLAVAGLLLLTQSRELATASLLPTDRWIVYGAIGIAVVAAGLRPRFSNRRSAIPSSEASARGPGIGVID